MKKDWGPVKPVGSSACGACAAEDSTILANGGSGVSAGGCSAERDYE